MSREPFMNSQNSPEWLDLKALQSYALVSERTLRGWLHSVPNPLPAARVGAKLLIRRRDFDAWLERHRLQTANPSQIIEKIVMELKQRL